jgi:heat shock protein HtpX
LRVGISIAYLCGYYVLLALAVGGLLWMSYRFWLRKDEVGAIMWFVCQLAGALILVSLPVPRRFCAPGTRLVPQEHPLLFERVRHIASLAGQVVPAEIYATEWAWTTTYYRGGIIGFGGRPILEIGLPLLHLVSVSQFEAILAREFGHIRRRDAITHQCIWKINEGLRCLWLMVNSPLTSYRRKTNILYFPFSLYRRIFASILQPICHAQELLADRFAADIAGSRALADALVILDESTGRFLKYREDEVLPAAWLGYEIPLIDGFAAYLEHSTNPPDRDWADCQPPLQERLSAIAHLPEGNTNNDSSALSLVNHLESLERAALATNAVPGQGRLRPIPWIEAGERVVVGAWARISWQGDAAYQDYSLDCLPSIVAMRLDAFARAIWAEREYAKEVLIAAFGYRLYREGWNIDHKPGSTLMIRDGETIDPVQLIKDMTAPEFTQDKWRQMLAGWKLDPLFPLDPHKTPPRSVVGAS